MCVCLPQCRWGVCCKIPGTRLIRCLLYTPTPYQNPMYTCTFIYSPISFPLSLSPNEESMQYLLQGSWHSADTVPSAHTYTLPNSHVHIYIYICSHISLSLSLSERSVVRYLLQGSWHLAHRALGHLTDSALGPLFIQHSWCRISKV